MKRLNPLFESTAAVPEVSNKDVPPISPLTGKPMIKVMCADIPAWVDLEARLALPVANQ